ncbi:MAG: redox-sensitive bicupin YhaK (pirin superfamily) [Planctomycetota bacterium]|jgi:redox-sensitive bicupin YhaK (pirin superfamily)
MTLTIRKSNDRGHQNHGWLDTHHTFSFADYADPHHMGFRSLRVINQDVIEKGMGFGTHPHRDMEIFSVIVSGAIAHKDSMGNQRVLRPGEIQLMSAGTGVTHSEFNPSETEALHLLQIWIEPSEQGLTPSYTEWQPNAATKSANDVVVISPDGRDDSAIIHSDAIVRRLRLAAGDSAAHEVANGRAMWLQVITGELRIGDEQLHPGDGASTEDSGMLAITANSAAEALLFDLG